MHLPTANGLAFSLALSTVACTTLTLSGAVYTRSGRINLASICLPSEKLRRATLSSEPESRMLERSVADPTIPGVTSEWLIEVIL